MLDGPRHEFESHEEDPRTVFADGLRSFFIQALEQQRVVNGRLGQRPAGFLYKLDGEFIKICLQAPAADRVFGLTGTGTTAAQPTSHPPLWALIPLGDYHEQHREFGIELEDVINDAETITVHVVPEGQEPVQFLVRDDYLGPAAPLYTTVEDLEGYIPPAEEEQCVAAANWAQALQYYDLRTIDASNRGVA